MIHKQQNWRDYQKHLKKTQARGRLKRFAAKALLCFPVFLISIYTATVFCTGTDNLSESHKKITKKPPSPRFTKGELQTLIDSKKFINIKNKDFDIVAQEKHLHVNTSIDMDLQHFLMKKISRVTRLNRGKPRYLAIVALDPISGRVLSLAGYNKTNDSNNPCLSKVFPAASIFKIVTAAAAVEACGFNPYSKFKFNGGKYTLYKNQLKERTNKYTNRISFKDSFAQSVNPVFGKIGSLYLGRETIEKYADAFGFNKPIEFETPLPQSRISLSNEPYQWAEIASGFNRETQISPLHGALLSGTIVNRGMVPEPTIIEKIFDTKGNILYNRVDAHLYQAIRPETSIVLKKLMATTISSGTGKKSFRGYKHDPILTRLNIGGKTGSIYNNAHDVRFDWFVGYAEEKKGDMKLAISVIVGHEKYIGTKASNYARMAISHYFGKQFAKKDDNHLIAKSETKSQTILR